MRYKKMTEYEKIYAWRFDEILTNKNRADLCSLYALMCFMQLNHYKISMENIKRHAENRFGWEEKKALKLLDEMEEIFDMD
jgi:hypothetical protein